MSTRLITHLTPQEIKTFMNRHGVSVEEMAEIFGVKDRTVYRWLSGERELSITNSRLVMLFYKYPSLIREF